MDRQMDVQAKIESLESFSAHAGRSEILQWLMLSSDSRNRFPDHGEPDAVEALSQNDKTRIWGGSRGCTGGKSYMLD